MNKQNLTHFKKLTQFILEMIRPFKIGILFMIFVALFCAFDFAFRKYLIKEILDTAARYQGHKDLVRELIFPVGLYTLMSLSITTLYRFYGYILDIKTFPRLKQKIADKGYVRLLSQNYHYYQKNLTGDLAHKLNNLIDGTLELIKVFIGRFLACALILIVSIYTLSFASLEFAISTLVWVIVFVTVSFTCFRTLSSLSDDFANKSAQVTANAADSLFNINSVMLFSNKIYERIKFFKSCKNKALSEKKLHKAYWFIWFVYGYSFDLLQIISLYFLIHGFYLNKLTLGDFALVIGLNVSIVEFLNQLTYDLTHFSDNYGKVSNAFSTIFANSQCLDRKEAKNLFVSQGNIVFDKIDFSYHSREILFNDLSVNIAAREKIALVGPSGAGKSSFVSLLLRLFDLRSGSILIDDQDILKVKQDSLREHISVIPQDLVLFHDSILENIRYGKTKAELQEIIEASKFAGIHRFISSLPHGYNTIVGEKGLKLSGGEKQRIAIARAFLKNAPILILDEATNQLDSITENEIQQSIVKLIRDKTTIVIAHRLSTLLHMDRILVFEKGKIIQEGTHNQLIVQDGLYKKMWDSQTNGFLNAG